MKIKKHTLILNTVFITGFILLTLIFIINQFTLPLKLSILILATLIYLIWAYLYHKLDKNLNIYIVLEYALTAFLVIILFAGFLS